MKRILCDKIRIAQSYDAGSLKYGCPERDYDAGTINKNRALRIAP
jgi:DNA/RNA-binding domain of Phe-tRNA-synthetase-like protein